MTLEDIKARIEEWQKTEHVHPLTCGNNSEHILKPEIRKVRSTRILVLACPHDFCGYVQDMIPEMFSEENFKIPELPFQKTLDKPDGG